MAKLCAAEGCNNPTITNRHKYCSDECKEMASYQRRGLTEKQVIHVKERISRNGNPYLLFGGGRQGEAYVCFEEEVAELLMDDRPAEEDTWYVLWHPISVHIVNDGTQWPKVVDVDWRGKAPTIAMASFETAKARSAGNSSGGNGKSCSLFVLSSLGFLILLIAMSSRARDEIVALTMQLLSVCAFRHSLNRILAYE